MNSKQFNSSWDDQQIALLDALFDAFVAGLPPLLSLTGPERSRVHPISDRRLPYAMKCLEGLKEHGQSLNLSPEEVAAIEKLAYDFEHLTHFRRLVEELAAAVHDTTLWVGGEYMNQCRVMHDGVRLAVRKGKPGMRALLDDLDRHNAVFRNRRFHQPKGRIYPLGVGDDAIK